MILILWIVITDHLEPREILGSSLYIPAGVIEIDEMAAIFPVEERFTNALKQRKKFTELKEWEIESDTHTHTEGQTDRHTDK